MAWTKLDDGIYDNPKILTVEPTDRLLYVWALCWSNRHHTDGVIPAKMLRYVAMFAGCGDHDAAASRLVEAGLWDNAPDGWTIHDFAEYQLSSDRVEDLRAKRAEAGRKGGQRSAETRRATNSPTKPEANAPANAEANGQQPGSKQASEIEPRPVPSPVTDVSSSSGTTRELSTGRDDDGPNIDLTSNPPPDDDGGDERVARAVADELGRRDSDRSPNRRVTPTRHAKACAADRWRLYRWHIVDLVRANPQATVLELADMVDQHAPAMAGAAAGHAAPPAPSPYVVVDGQSRYARTLLCPTCEGRTGHDDGTCPLADPDPGAPTP